MEGAAGDAAVCWECVVGWWSAVDMGGIYSRGRSCNGWVSLALLMVLVNKVGYGMSGACVVDLYV